MKYSVIQILSFTTKIVCLFSYIMLVSCTMLSPQPSSVSDNDATLKELAEVHKEIKALRAEMGELRQAVTDINHRSDMTPSTSKRPYVVAKVRLESEDPVLGNREAKVGIIEFSDYQCPLCFRFHMQILPKLKKSYRDSGKVQYFFRNFPLGFHRKAKGAAIAANCAGKQGAYWDMHHDLFTNQRRLGARLYERLANKLKLNVQAFRACLKEPTQAQEVEKDLAYGRRLGVRRIPSFFVGRLQDGQLVDARRVTGAQSFQAFVQTIDLLLQ